MTADNDGISLLKKREMEIGIATHLVRAFSEFCREISCEETGSLLSCARDKAFLESFDDSLELVRKKGKE